MGNVRKPYEKPNPTSLTPEQAKQKLLRLVKGGEQAKKLLEIMLPEKRKKDSENKKKSALSLVLLERSMEEKRCCG